MLRALKVKSLPNPSYPMKLRAESITSGSIKAINLVLFNALGRSIRYQSHNNSRVWSNSFWLRNRYRRTLQTLDWSLGRSRALGNRFLFDSGAYRSIMPPKQATLGYVTPNQPNTPCGRTSLFGPWLTSNALGSKFFGNGRAAKAELRQSTSAFHRKETPKSEDSAELEERRHGGLSGAKPGDDEDGVKAQAFDTTTEAARSDEGEDRQDGANILDDNHVAQHVDVVDECQCSAFHTFLYCMASRSLTDEDTVLRSLTKRSCYRLIA